MAIRTTSTALMPLHEALGLLLDVAPVAPATVAVVDAIGSVPAEDVVAPADCPPRPGARRDGWAVAAGDVVGASAYAPIPLSSPAIRVDDGEDLPPGTDTVLPPDALDPSGEIVADAAPGDGATRPGQDLASGDVVARQGRCLTALQGLALAAACVTEIRVRVPRIHIVAAVSPGSETHAGALAALLAAGIVRHGGRATSAQAGRDADALARAIGAAEADAVFVLGGTGFGRTDHAAQALEEAGILDAHGIALDPGGSAGFGRIGRVPVLLLPGRPDGALAAFLALGLPLLRRLAGASAPATRRASLTRKISSAIGLSEIMFVRSAEEGVEPLGGADLPLRRLILAEGAVLVPPDREGYREGELVEIVPL